MKKYHEALLAVQSRQAFTSSHKQKTRCEETLKETPFSKALNDHLVSESNLAHPFQLIALQVQSHIGHHTDHLPQLFSLPDCGHEGGDIVLLPSSQRE